MSIEHYRLLSTNIDGNNGRATNQNIYEYT
jgi:hypothetical protein